MRMRTLASAAALTAATLTPVVAVQAPGEAATKRTWERLAHCESGGRWHINTGNGYFGGLQISPGTWRGYGGRRFARLPHGATKREQIKVAERIKRGQGWGAWPACTSRLGLR
ncbi:transglycosylase family protein [Nocardioides sp. YIM 152315]|uniref:transglycosylase family protein n=1 Tax=Nocardioides sp. YIM 152315 TaxID=3031760 RepID=UPI0023DAF4AC|nr:transglycosylase family protein [Nocardioides sp. YIM 152315]MDF1606407.1 transglycosylase family protein [Nocardioides sp. YIM 152315]